MAEYTAEKHNFNGVEFTVYSGAVPGSLPCSFCNELLTHHHLQDKDSKLGGWWYKFKKGTYLFGHEKQDECSSPLATETHCLICNKLLLDLRIKYYRSRSYTCFNCLNGEFTKYDPIPAYAFEARF